MLAVVSQFRHRFTDIIHRLMRPLLGKAVKNFRLPAARQLFQGADIEITVVEVGFQLRHVFKQENDGSVALLKGQEMGRFKLGSTVINLFAPGKVNLVEQLESLSVTKIGQPLAVSTETFVTPDAEPAPLPAEEIEAEHDASPLVDDKKDQV